MGYLGYSYILDLHWTYFYSIGGAQAVYDAVEKKVNEYGDNVIDFYDIVRGNMKLVKPPNTPSNWNPDLGNLFITAVGVEALGAFAEWLTSEGGWLNGTNVNDSYSIATFDASRYADFRSPFTCITSIVGEWETVDDYSRAPVIIEGTSVRVTLTGNDLYTFTDSGLYTRIGLFAPQSNYHYGLFESYGDSDLLYENLYFGSIISKFNLSVTKSEFSKNAQVSYIVRKSNNYPYLWAGAIYDGYFYTLGRVSNNNAVYSELSADIDIPEEIPEIKPLPTLEGLLLESETLAGDSLERFGEVVETYFTDTGTIPVPQPNIVADPDVVPNPTPVPTPNPSPEIEDIEDLGLPTLGEAIFSKFPFSLPKDLKRISDILNAEPVTPYWEVDLYETLGDRIPFQGSTIFTIDLEEYEELGEISRWASVITFVVFLIIITKGVIRW